MLAKLIDYIVASLVKYVPAYVMGLIAEWQRKQKRKVEQAAAQASYDAVIAKPDATVEERAKAYENLINSGR